MSNYNKVNRVLIGDGTASAAVNLAGITAGELLIVDESGVLVTTNADALLIPKHKKVFIAAGIGNGIAILSSPIQGNTVSAYEGGEYAAPVQKSVIVGYNGVAGTGISYSTTSGEYRLRVNILDDHRTNGMRQTFSDYNATGASAEECFKKILCISDQEDYDQSAMKDYVTIEGVSDGTGTVLPKLAVVKGSTAVKSVAHGLIVGDYVRVGGATTDFPVYPVKTIIDADNVALAVSYKGETNPDIAGSKVEAGASEFGFVITGIEQQALLSRGANEPWGRYEWVNFNAYYGEASDREFSESAVATVSKQINPGNGYWKQVAYEEEQAKGYLGDTSKRRFDDTRIASNVQVDVEYQSITIIHSEVMPGDFQGVYVAPLKTNIYVPKDTDQATNSGDNFLHILNGFFGATGKVGFPDIEFA